MDVALPAHMQCRIRAQLWLTGKVPVIWFNSAEPFCRIIDYRIIICVILAAFVMHQIRINKAVLFLFTTILLLSGLLPVHAKSKVIRYGNQQIDLVYDWKLNTAERENSHSWLRRVADALITVYGELPQDKFTINLRKTSSNSGPVPWGQVSRDPSEILLVINPDYGFDEILGDWTAFHEISHLLIPYRGYGDLWFSEGLATYYQNIIRARSGLITEVDLWDRIISGFERGHAQNQWSHLSLSVVSDNMREYPAYMRVHWSGVHYWLSTDVRLRQSGKSLDNALKKLRDCCAGRSMSAEEIAIKLDELSNENIFLDRFEQYRVSNAMMDYRKLKRDLGLVRHDNRLVLIPEARLEEIRNSIYRGG